MNNKRIVSVFLAASIALLLLGEKSYCKPADYKENKSCIIGCSADHSVRKLMKGNWAPFAYDALQKLIDDYGIKNSKYDKNHKHYAVFDWDNTAIFNDAADAFFIYQIENLQLKFTPQEFSSLLRKNVPKKNFSNAYKNKEGKLLNIDLIAEDLDRDYKYLYENYEGFKGKKSLEEIKKTEEYKDFITKTIFLFYAIDDTFGSELSFLWSTYFVAGMTKEEVMKIAEKSIDYNIAQPIGKKALTSSSTKKGKTGVVSIEVNNGLRVIKEQVDLMNTLRTNGIEVYICSASFVAIVKTFASNQKYGYNLPEENIIALELETDEKGIIKPEYRKGYVPTIKEGKTKNIERFLVSKYGYGPILVGGDSSGDVPLMVDFKDTKKVLIINRLMTGKIGELSKEAANTIGNPKAKYLLQGRDENTGEFRPSEKTVPFGETEAREKLISLLPCILSE